MAKRKKGASARDLAEIRSGKASARDRAEAGLGHSSGRSGKRRKHMSNTPKRKGKSY
jgi:hypothetical protein